MTILVYVGLNPWGLHIGQRWTPAMTWHGVGKLQSTTGAVYGLFLEVSPDMPYRRHTTAGGSDDLRGMAKLCTPLGEIYPLTLSSHIKLVWLDVDRKQATFYLRSPKNAQPKLNFEFYGRWQGQQLVLEDQGDMAMSFAADGHAKGYI